MTPGVPSLTWDTQDVITELWRKMKNQVSTVSLLTLPLIRHHWGHTVSGDNDWWQAVDGGSWGEARDQWQWPASAPGPDWLLTLTRPLRGEAGLGTRRTSANSHSSHNIYHKHIEHINTTILTPVLLFIIIMGRAMSSELLSSFFEIILKRGRCISRPPFIQRPSHHTYIFNEICREDRFL